MCKQVKEHSCPESVHYISGSLHGLPGNESPPLARTCGGHFVLPAPFQRRQLCSSEEISETGGTHGVSFGSMSYGLITHATTAAMAEISSPLDSMDFGTFEYRGHLRLHRSSGAVAQPGSLQPGSPPGFGDFTRGGHNRRIDARLGSGVRGNASFGTVVGTSDPMAHKPLGIGSSLFSSKGVSSTTGTATCTGLERQHVLIRTDNTSLVSYINRQGGIRSKALCEQAAILLLWADSRLLSIRATHIPGLLNRGADMLSRRRIPQGGWRLHPESVQMIWNLYGKAEVDLFATSENAHCPLFFSLSHSPLEGDALTAHWPAARLYAFPPIKILPLVLCKIREERAVSDTHSPELAEPALVSRPDRAVDSSSLADSGQEGHAIPGGRLGVAPEPGTMEPSCVAASGLSEELNALQSRVIDTLTEARAPSTRRLYALKWGVFVKWCHQAHIDPVTCTVLDVLSFLQYRLDSGSLPSTLKVYVAAIAAFRSPQGGQSIGRNAMVVSFLKGARRLHPPRTPSVPPWDLEVVLRALSQPPFEPLTSVGLKELSLKTTLLLALASAKRIGDLHAFSVDSDCIRFGPGDCSVTLRPRMGYVPKSLSTPFKTSQQPRVKQTLRLRCALSGL